MFGAHSAPEPRATCLQTPSRRGDDLGGRQTGRAAGSIRSLFRSPCSRARATALQSGARVPPSGRSTPYCPLRAVGRPRRAVAAAAFALSLESSCFRAVARKQQLSRRRERFGDAWRSGPAPWRRGPPDNRLGTDQVGGAFLPQSGGRGSKAPPTR